MEWGGEENTRGRKGAGSSTAVGIFSFLKWTVCTLSCIVELG